MRITRVTMLATALVLAQLTQVLIGLVAQRGANSAWSIFATGAMRQLAKTHRQMRSTRSKRKRWPRTRLIRRAS
jgi:hypothetical protein